MIFIRFFYVIWEVGMRYSQVVYSFFAWGDGRDLALDFMLVLQVSVCNNSWYFQVIRRPRNKDCPVAILFAKIAIQDAFFHGFMYKRLFLLSKATDHMGSSTGLQKQDRQQGWCANTGSTGYCPWWYSNFEWKLLGAGRGFEPLTFRLWAWRATGLLHPALV